MIYVDRDYRLRFDSSLEMHCLAVKETDLAIYLPQGVWNEQIATKTEQFIRQIRCELEEYIAITPDFAATHNPYLVDPAVAPPIALAMARAGNIAGVGPMAAVAGAFSYAVGQFLLPYSTEVVVENGGDIFIAGKKDRVIGVFAGKSPFSHKIGLKISKKSLPLGVCTSSGTVGPSFSYGKADAVVILAPDALLADAVATAAANMVQTEEDLEKSVAFAKTIKGVTGILAIKNSQMAAWGDIELVPL